MLLLGLHLCKLRDYPNHTAITLIFSSIKLTNINMIRTNTRMITTAWRLSLPPQPIIVSLVSNPRALDRFYKDFLVFERFNEEHDPNPRSLDVSSPEYIRESLCEFL